MSKTASTKQIIELLQEFEAKHGPSVVSDIIVRTEADRDVEYIFFITSQDGAKDRVFPIHVPSVEYETFQENN